MVNVCIFRDFPSFAEHVYLAESEFYRRENIPFPCINLEEDREAIRVRALMPGVREANLRLTLGERALIVEGELPPPPGRYYRQERFSGPFRRVVALSAPVRHDAVTACLRDGVLDMTLPKRPAAVLRPFFRASAHGEGRMNPQSLNPVHRRRIRPATDIVERPDGILALVNLPGVAPEDLSVSADQRYLRIRTLSRREGPGPDSADTSVLALEFVNRGYDMKIALSPAQDIDTIEARLKNGVLSVLLPRRHSPRPRRIPVVTDGD